MSIEGVINGLLKDLRQRELFRRNYKTDCNSLKRRATFEADCIVRQIVAVEELVAFRDNHLPSQSQGAINETPVVGLDAKRAARVSKRKQRHYARQMKNLGRRPDA